ncbi:hypothetical protein QZH41_004521 [Actinostola sp. cb2023]|nr:hypothetical protein QZH41_004521 [Actinostola sp. cb2023]
MGNLANVCLTTAFCIVILAGLVGNSLVILIIARNKFLRRKKPISTVLLNLAVADSTVLLFLAPRHIFFGLTIPYHIGETGDLLCKFVTGGNIAWIGAITSICSLLLIAAERFYAVCLPHQYSTKFTRKLVRKLLILSWLFGFLFNLPLFFVVGYNKNMTFCIEDWGSTIASRINAIMWTLTAGVIPLCVMVYFYSNVIFSLWIKKGEVGGGQLVIRQIRQRTRKRVSKALLVISFLYCASWFPPLTNYILVYFEPKHSFSNVTYLASVVMVAFNSAVNPVIYAFYSGLFRQHLKNLLFRKLVPRRVMALDNPNPVSATNGLTAVKDVFAPGLKALKFSDVMGEIQAKRADNETPTELFDTNNLPTGSPAGEKR